VPPPAGSAGAASFFGFLAFIASVCDQKARDRGRILQRGAHHLRGVDDALGIKVAVPPARRNEADLGRKELDGSVKLYGFGQPVMKAAAV